MTDTNGKRLFIARHGETIFNLAGRIQGGHVHTPLSRAGFAQADAMGAALAGHIGAGARVKLVASDTDRALQTLSIIAEHLDHDWHGATTDERLREIDMGEWGGRYYRDIAPDIGALLDAGSKLFVKVAPGGESYPKMAERLRDWIVHQTFDADTLIVMHGMSSRVLRGLLTEQDDHPLVGAPVADSLTQGSMVEIVDGVERIVVDGAGGGEVA